MLLESHGVSSLRRLFQLPGWRMKSGPPPMLRLDFRRRRRIPSSVARIRGRENLRLRRLVRAAALSAKIFRPPTTPRMKLVKSYGIQADACHPLTGGGPGYRYSCPFWCAPPPAVPVRHWPAAMPLLQPVSDPRPWPVGRPRPSSWPARQGENWSSCGRPRTGCPIPGPPHHGKGWAGIGQNAVGLNQFSAGVVGGLIFSLTMRQAVPGWRNRPARRPVFEPLNAMRLLLRNASTGVEMEENNFSDPPPGS